MIKIGIDPNIAEFGGFVIAWHGVFTAVGILAGVMLAAHLMRSFGENPDSAYNAVIWAVPSAIIGARILHVVSNWNYYSGSPADILQINEGGIAVWGAVFGGILGGLVFVWRSKTPLGPFADAAGLGLLAGMAIGRIGDVINGEHWGTPSKLPWSVQYTHPETLGERFVSVHPAVAYELLWDVAILALLLWLLPRIRVRGVVFWLFLILYSVGRLWTHIFRKDEPAFLGLQEAQAIAGLVILLSVPAVLWVWRRGNERLREQAMRRADISNTPAISHVAEERGRSEGDAPVISSG